MQNPSEKTQMILTVYQRTKKSYTYGHVVIQYVDLGKPYLKSYQAFYQKKKKKSIVSARAWKRNISEKESLKKSKVEQYIKTCFKT